MAITASDRITPAASRNGRTGPLAGLKSFWHEFVAKAFHPYRPELHYMRGPGPAWRAKHGELAAFRLKTGDF
ncbi:hypothetical protein [Bradyrhizobium sp. ARR65]|uniref:hypothetical protein n=1 Tax=Bradyrhizobium sp. ARR65 TaxID=1040989 RepID=UPI0004662BE6|nr:hypothetical protein [Bradyrhizobium sp. ARR65]